MARKVMVGFVLTTMLVVSVNGYQRFPIDSVPLPESAISHLSDQQKEKFAEDLGSIALSADLSEEGSARIFAAARVFSPLNRKVIHSEHYRVNQMPQKELTPIPKEAIEEKLTSLKSLIGSDPANTGFFAWLDTVLTRYQVDPNDRKNSVYSFSITPNRISAKFSTGAEGAFEFVTKRKSTFTFAIREPMKYMTSLYPDELAGKRVEFTAVALGKDSCLACGILTKAYIKGDKLDENTGFCGGLSADGVIQKSERIYSVLSFLDHSDQNPAVSCVVLPNQNIYQLNDYLITNGPGLFLKYTFIGVSSIEEAYEWAPVARSEKVKTVTSLFGSIQKVLKQPNAKQYLTNTHVRERLKKVTSLEPNHLSAAMIQKLSLGEVPAHLSLNYTIARINPLVEMIRINQDLSRMIGGSSRVDQGIRDLKANYQHIHPAMRKLVVAAVKYHDGTKKDAEFLSLYQSIMDNPNFRNRLNQGL